MAITREPKGEQMDFVEVIELNDDGLIQYHKVYWGWRGFAVLEKNEYANRSAQRTRPITASRFGAYGRLSSFAVIFAVILGTGIKYGRLFSAVRCWVPLHSRDLTLDGGDP